MRRIGKAKTLLRDAAPCDPKHGWKKGAGKCVRSAKQEGGTSNRGKVAIAAGILGSIAAGGIGIAAISGRTTKPTPNAETKPAPKVETKPAPKAETKPDPKAEAKPDPKVETKPAPNAETKPAPKVETKPDPKAETKPAPKVETKPDPKAETKPAPKAETKPDPKVETKPAPKAETKPDPKVETKPAPKAETKPAPKVETKPASKVETKPAPKVETKPDLSTLKDFGDLLKNSRKPLPIAELPKEEKVNVIQRWTGVDPEKARRIMLSIEEFTISGGGQIRSSEKNKGSYYIADDIHNDGEEIDVVKEVNDFFDLSPKYHGSIFRGLRIHEDEFDEFMSEATSGFVSNAMSSYSSNFSVAGGFATKSSPRQIPVIYSIKDNKTGVDIRDLSELRDEEEVLQPAGAKLRAVKIEKMVYTSKVTGTPRPAYIFHMEEIEPEKQKQRRNEMRKETLRRVEKEEERLKELENKQEGKKDSIGSTKQNRESRFVETDWKTYQSPSRRKTKKNSRVDRAKSLLVNSAVLQDDRFGG